MSKFQTPIASETGSNQATEKCTKSEPKLDLFLQKPTNNQSMEIKETA